MARPEGCGDPGEDCAGQDPGAGEPVSIEPVGHNLPAGLPEAKGTQAPAPFGQFLKRTRNLARAGLDFVLPPTCLACRAPVDETGAVCGACWSKLSFLTPPQCDMCGLPFPYPLPEGMPQRCGACLAKPPAYSRARAALVYDDASRDLILGFKHGDRLESADLFARWMARCAGDVLTGDALIVPVPLHRWRLARRKYNQAALLARALSRLTGLDWAPRVLRRPRATVQQKGLSPAARRRNVAGAFDLDPRQAHLIAGRPVVLIDDVLTTGATVESAARTLKAAGSGPVDVVVLARAPGARVLQ